MITRTRLIPAARMWLGAALLALALTGCGADSEVKLTLQGPVRGLDMGDQLAFRGIPYAAAPVGGLRFQPPQPPAFRGKAILDATEFAPACAQGGGAFGSNSTAEDCLYLNVYTPKTPGPHPVMVWIHGGAFVTGSGGETYDPSRLVAHGVVVVTVNYRLGALGFLAHPALTAEQGASGDYGIMDQQAALRWVKANIAFFNGDPRNVTIFGESAGGHSVLTHLASSASRGLFDKAIVQSGSYQPDQRTLAQAEAQGLAIAQSLGCDTLDCLRAAPVEAVLAAQAAHAFVPNTRPDILPNPIQTALATGDFNRVPVMAGTNLDEWRLFVALDELTNLLTTGDRRPLTAERYRDAVAADLGGGVVGNLLADAAVAEYPLSDYPNPSIALGAIGTDAIFACNGLSQAMTLAQYVPMYAYEFADRDALNILAPFTPSFDLGAAHALEIPYVLASEATLQAGGATPTQVELAHAMATYWTRFARTGNPNPRGGHLPFWPSYNAAGNFLSLAPGAVEELPSAAFAMAHHCGFWANPLGAR